MYIAFFTSYNVEKNPHSKSETDFADDLLRDKWLLDSSLTIGLLCLQKSFMSSNHANVPIRREAF